MTMIDMILCTNTQQNIISTIGPLNRLGQGPSHVGTQGVNQSINQEQVEL
jgi:hypothetical protein